MTDKWIMPNDQQQAQGDLVQQDVLELLNRLIAEGIDKRVVVAGMASATFDLITCTFGPTAIVPWLERQAQIVRDLQKPN